MTVTFLYGDHGKYIEVEQDIFEYNQLDYLYVFQPRFLKNLTSVVINAQGQRLEFGFEVSGDRMTVKAPDGTVWSETTYAGEFPAQRVTSTAARNTRRTTRETMSRRTGNTSKSATRP